MCPQTQLFLFVSFNSVGHFPLEHGHIFGVSMDWFKGKSTGNHGISHQIWCFPVNFPLNQSIEGKSLFQWPYLRKLAPGAEPSLAPRDQFDAARQQCSAGGGYDNPDVDDRWDRLARALWMAGKIKGFDGFSWWFICWYLEKPGVFKW